MAVLTATGTSSANTAQTITITLPSTKNRIFIRHLTVTTKGADPATDVTIDIKDNGTTVYPLALRAGSVFGANMDFGKGIPIRAGNCTVVIGAAGANAITVAGVVYEII